MEIYEFQKDPEVPPNCELVDESEIFLNQYSFGDKMHQPLQNMQPEKLPETLPKWLEMPDLLRKSEEEDYLDEFVLLAGAAINHESFHPLPPKSPKSPKSMKSPDEIPVDPSEKLSQIADEEPKVDSSPVDAISADADELQS